MPNISVIVPIYRVEQYLSDCVESVLSQTYSDFELILVDDGSPDRSGAICDTFAEKDSRIRVIHKENGGLSSARNAGLDIAQGKYVYFLDGDDTIHPELLSRVLPYLEDGADLVAFHFQWVYPDGKTEPCLYHENGSFACSSQEDRVRFIIEKLLMEQIGWEACTRVFRREKIESYKLRFEDNRRIFAEDLYFSLCYCAHADKIVSLSDCLYNYLQRDTSIMGENWTQLNIGRMNELGKAVLAFYQEWEDCNLLEQAFPAIHHLIMRNVIRRAHDRQNCLYPEIREKAYQELDDVDFFEDQLKNLSRTSSFLKKVYSNRELAEQLNLAQYFLDGNYFKYRVKGKIIRELTSK